MSDHDDRPDTDPDAEASGVHSPGRLEPQSAGGEAKAERSLAEGVREDAAFLTERAKTERKVRRTSDDARRERPAERANRARAEFEAERPDAFDNDGRVRGAQGTHGNGPQGVVPATHASGIKRHNAPIHYGAADDPYETHKVIRAWGLNFNIGSAVKYLSRLGKKHPGAEGQLADLRKVIDFVGFEIDYLERKPNDGRSGPKVTERTTWPAGSPMAKAIEAAKRKVPKPYTAEERRRLGLAPEGPNQMVPPDSPMAVELIRLANAVPEAPNDHELPASAITNIAYLSTGGRVFRFDGFEIKADPKSLPEGMNPVGVETAIAFLEAARERGSILSFKATGYAGYAATDEGNPVAECVMVARDSVTMVPAMPADYVPDVKEATAVVVEMRDDGRCRCRPGQESKMSVDITNHAEAAGGSVAEFWIQLPPVGAPDLERGSFGVRSLIARAWAERTPIHFKWGGYCYAADVVGETDGAAYVHACPPPFKHGGLIRGRGPVTATVPAGTVITPIADLFDRFDAASNPGPTVKVTTTEYGVPTIPTWPVEWGEGPSSNGLPWNNELETLGELVYRAWKQWVIEDCRIANEAAGVIEGDPDFRRPVDELETWDGMPAPLRELAMRVGNVVATWSLGVQTVADIKPLEAWHLEAVREARVDTWRLAVDVAKSVINDLHPDIYPSNRQGAKRVADLLNDNLAESVERVNQGRDVENVEAEAVRKARAETWRAAQDVANAVADSDTTPSASTSPAKRVAELLGDNARNVETQMENVVATGGTITSVDGEPTLAAVVAEMLTTVTTRHESPTISRHFVAPEWIEKLSAMVGGQHHGAVVPDPSTMSKLRKERAETWRNAQRVAESVFSDEQGDVWNEGAKRVAELLGDVARDVETTIDAVEAGAIVAIVDGAQRPSMAAFSPAGETAPTDAITDERLTRIERDAAHNVASAVEIHKMAAECSDARTAARLESDRTPDIVSRAALELSVWQQALAIAKEVQAGLDSDGRQPANGASIDGAQGCQLRLMYMLERAERAVERIRTEQVLPSLLEVAMMTNDEIGRLCRMKSGETANPSDIRWLADMYEGACVGMMERGIDRLRLRRLDDLEKRISDEMPMAENAAGAYTVEDAVDAMLRNAGMPAEPATELSVWQRAVAIANEVVATPTDAPISGEPDFVAGAEGVRNRLYSEMERAERAVKPAAEFSDGTAKYAHCSCGYSCKLSEWPADRLRSGTWKHPIPESCPECSRWNLWPSVDETSPLLDGPVYQAKPAEPASSFDVTLDPARMEVGDVAEVTGGDDTGYTISGAGADIGDCEWVWLQVSPTPGRDPVMLHGLCRTGEGQKITKHGRNGIISAMTRMLTDAAGKPSDINAETDALIADELVRFVVECSEGEAIGGTLSSRIYPDKIRKVAGARARTFADCLMLSGEATPEAFGIKLVHPKPANANDHSGRLSVTDRMQIACANARLLAGRGHVASIMVDVPDLEFVLQCQRNLEMIASEREGEVWCWDGDDIAQNHVESLSCPVLMQWNEARDLVRSHEQLIRLRAGRSLGLSDVATERGRQMSAEGWTPEHDDEHIRHEMPRAAAYYALHGSHQFNVRVQHSIWPWGPEYRKPKGDRENYVRAAALLIAEIDRIDRVEKVERAAAALDQDYRGEVMQHPDLDVTDPETMRHIDDLLQAADVHTLTDDVERMTVAQRREALAWGMALKAMYAGDVVAEPKQPTFIVPTVYGEMAYAIELPGDETTPPAEPSDDDPPRPPAEVVQTLTDISAARDDTPTAEPPVETSLGSVPAEPPAEPGSALESIDRAISHVDNVIDQVSKLINDADDAPAEPADIAPVDELRQGGVMCNQRQVLALSSAQLRDALEWVRNDDVERPDFITSANDIGAHRLRDQPEIPAQMPCNMRAGKLTGEPGKLSEEATRHADEAVESATVDGWYGDWLRFQYHAILWLPRGHRATNMPGSDWRQRLVEQDGISTRQLRAKLREQAKAAKPEAGALFQPAETIDESHITMCAMLKAKGVNTTPEEVTHFTSDEHAAAFAWVRMDSVERPAFIVDISGHGEAPLTIHTDVFRRSAARINAARAADATGRPGAKFVVRLTPRRWISDENGFHSVLDLGNAYRFDSKADAILAMVAATALAKWPDAEVRDLVTDPPAEPAPTTGTYTLHRENGNIPEAVGDLDGTPHVSKFIPTPPTWADWPTVSICGTRLYPASVPKPTKCPRCKSDKIGCLDDNEGCLVTQQCRDCDAEWKPAPAEPAGLLPPSSHILPPALPGTILHGFVKVEIDEDAERNVAFAKTLPDPETGFVRCNSCGFHGALSLFEASCHGILLCGKCRGMDTTPDTVEGVPHATGGGTLSIRAKDGKRVGAVDIDPTPSVTVVMPASDKVETVVTATGDEVVKVVTDDGEKVATLAPGESVTVKPVEFVVRLNAGTWLKNTDGDSTHQYRDALRFDDQQAALRALASAKRVCVRGDTAWPSAKVRKFSHVFAASRMAVDIAKDAEEADAAADDSTGGLAPDWAGDGVEDMTDIYDELDGTEADKPTESAALDEPKFDVLDMEEAEESADDWPDHGGYPGDKDTKEYDEDMALLDDGEAIDSDDDLPVPDILSESSDAWDGMKAEARAAREGDSQLANENSEGAIPRTADRASEMGDSACGITPENVIRMDDTPVGSGFPLISDARGMGMCDDCKHYGTLLDWPAEHIDPDGVVHCPACRRTSISENLAGGAWRWFVRTEIGAFWYLSGTGGTSTSDRKQAFAFETYAAAVADRNDWTQARGVVFCAFVPAESGEDGEAEGSGDAPVFKADAAPGFGLCSGCGTMTPLARWARESIDINADSGVFSLRCPTCDSAKQITENLGRGAWKWVIVDGSMFVSNSGWSSNLRHAVRWSKRADAAEHMRTGAFRDDYSEAKMAMVVPWYFAEAKPNAEGGGE